MNNFLVSVLVLAVTLLIWAAFELQHQRDFYKELYCAEVLQENPDHPVCGVKNETIL